MVGCSISLDLSSITCITIVVDVVDIRKELLLLELLSSLVLLLTNLRLLVFLPVYFFGCSNSLVSSGAIYIIIFVNGVAEAIVNISIKLIVVIVGIIVGIVFGKLVVVIFAFGCSISIRLISY